MNTAESVNAIFAAHAAITFSLTGIIWFVQVVHYPLFSAFERSEFPVHHRFHTNRTGLVVAPMMVLEMAGAILLLFLRPVWAEPGLLELALGLVILIWLSTFLLQVRYHSRLANGYDDRAHRLLESTNWIRTGCWTIRSALLLSQLPSAASL